MFYTIYKVTNNLNGKIYIGKHQTRNLDDGYMGSGKHLKYAIKKYGLENFTKEILHVFDNEVDMNAKEAELVTEDFLKEDTNYNLCPGGQGGWGYINLNRFQNTELANNARRKWLLENKDKMHRDGRKYNTSNATEAFKRIYPNGTKGMLGRTHNIETKQKMSAAASSKNNSQYGSMWITDGTNNRKIKKTEEIPSGWVKGRKIK